MKGVLTRLSDTRWSYRVGGRLYYIRCRLSPNEDTDTIGMWDADDGDGEPVGLCGWSVEQVAYTLDHRPPLRPARNP